MAEYTEADALKEFNQISKALQDGDSEKLSTIMEKQPPEEEVTIEPEVPAVEPEVKDDSNEEETPPAVAEKPEDDKVAEPTELEKLQQQLEKLSKENHNLKSQAGRVPHVQRKIKELDEKLEKLAQASTTPSSQPSTKLQPKIDALLAGVKDADPELASAIAAAILEATNGLAEESATKERESLQFLRDQEVQTYQDIEAERLLGMYPNAPEVFRSPTWKEWKTQQPGGILRLAESDSADDVAYAFKKYAEDMVAKYPELAKVEDGTKAASPPISEAASDRAKQVEAERERKKTTAVTVGNPSAPGKVGLPADDLALFNKFSEEIRKERTG